MRLVKVAVANVKTTVGAVRSNVERAIGFARAMAADDVTLGVYQEQLVGGYPPGQRWDLCRTAPDAPALERIRTLGFPATDPVTGPGGALTKLWRSL